MAVNKLFGIKRPKEFGRKISEGQRRRAALGLQMGRARKSVTYRFACQVCGKVVEDKHGSTKRVACSQKHGQIIARRNAKKLPSDEIIAELYLSGLTGPQISDMYGCKGHHNGIYQALDRLGIKRRKSGARTFTICVEEGCNEPVHKVWHSQLKGYYGRRCKQHHEARIKNWSKQGALKKKLKRQAAIS